jgi:hypothetical protein
MTGPGGAILALLAALCAAALSPAAPAQSSTIEYLYIEPNEGGSSGGHAALRFGDRVYDFHNHDLGTLRLARHNHDHFRYVYSVLENRTIHVAQIETTPETYDALRNHFNERYFIQRRHFAILESLRNDRTLIEMVRDTRTVSGAGPDVPSGLSAVFRGVGFFHGPTASTPMSRTHAAVPEARALAALRARVREVHGDNFLRTRIAAMRADMARLEPPVSGTHVPSVSRNEYPRAPYGFSEQYIDLGLKVLALDTLRHARPVLPEARMAPDDAEFDLSASERDRLRAFADALGARLIELMQSERPDWGSALLVGMARLDVLAESLDTGRLVVLDAFSPDASIIEFSGNGDRTAFVAELRDEARREWRAIRARVFTADALHESDISALEDACNRYVEIERGLAEDQPIRVQADPLIPARTAAVSDLPLPTLNRARLEPALAGHRDAERTYIGRLRQEYGYNLLTRNCVSEIFDTIDSRFDRSRSIARLGGYVDPHDGFNFVPSASFRAVTDSYRVIAQGEIPSYRTQRLDQMYAAENSLKVYLRESNTLTSTVYRKGESDSLFLFFTDDVVLPRPLYGAANILAGLGETLVGTLRAPIDGGRTLWSGARGIAFSLPELAFVNLRKGTLIYARTDQPRTALRLRDEHPDREPWFTDRRR